jgi:hypothetical protein
MSLILRRLRSSCLEGRTLLTSRVFNFFTRSEAGAHVPGGFRLPLPRLLLLLLEVADAVGGTLVLTVHGA